MKAEHCAGRQARGFTLIETVIAMAVAALLATLAYPTYQSALQKSRRAQARLALLELVQSQERYMASHNTYLSFSNTGGVTDPAAAAGLFRLQAGTAQAPSHWISASTCSGRADVAECIQAVATPTGTDDPAGTLFLDTTGTRGCTGLQPALCWP